MLYVYGRRVSALNYGPQRPSRNGHPQPAAEYLDLLINSRQTCAYYGRVALCGVVKEFQTCGDPRTSCDGTEGLRHINTQEAENMDPTLRDPLPLLVVRRGPIGSTGLALLQHDSRIQMHAIDELSAEWIGFADRMSGVLVATHRDPLAGLLYALSAGVRVPIVVAARSQYRYAFRDVVRAGAACCITLPIRPASVDLLMTCLRRQGVQAQVDAGSRLLLDPVARLVRCQSMQVRLTQREFALLHCLSGRQGQPVACDELHRYVWGGALESRKTQQIVAVYVLQLRRKLAQLGLGSMIVTVRGFGYALRDPGASIPARWARQRARSRALLVR